MKIHMDVNTGNSPGYPQAMVLSDVEEKDDVLQFLGNPEKQFLEITCTFNTMNKLLIHQKVIINKKYIAMVLP